jgi:hypothetical protein
LTLSDGTTTLTIDNDNVREDEDVSFDKSTRTTAGGQLKSQVTGQRVSIDVEIRVTQAEVNSIMDLLTNGADEYYYSPKTDYSTLYPTLADPFKISVEKLKKTFDNISKYYISFQAIAVDYL